MSARMSSQAAAAEHAARGQHLSARLGLERSNIYSLFFKKKQPKKIPIKVVRCPIGLFQGGRRVELWRVPRRAWHRNQTT